MWSHHSIPVHSSSAILRGYLSVPGTVLDAAATPGRMLGKIPTAVEFLDRWRAAIKNQRDISKYILINYVK